MSRLYLRFYFALLGSLLVFAVAAGCVWHLFFAPEVQGSGTVGRLLHNALPPSDAPASEQQAALERLVAGLNMDVALVASDGAQLAAVGKPIALPADAHARVMHAKGEVVGSIHLSDGRRLVASMPLGNVRPEYAVGLMLLALTLAVGVAAFPIVRRLATRLERLQKGVESLGAGELSARIAVEGKDEVARLAESFNGAAARIEELVGAHRRLLANASHELRTPLTRIRLAIELMKDGVEPARKQGLNQDIAELDRLIDEILLASRLDAISDTAADEDIDLLALAAEECAHYEETELDGTPVSVRGDPRLLRRLLRNLLENARHHGVPPTHVTLAADARFITLTVSDEGPAIPLAECEQLFTPFHRRSQARDSSGAGLGLSLVRQIARRHGGDARCESTPAGHLRFVVTLARSS